MVSLTEKGPSCDGPFLLGTVRSGFCLLAHGNYDRRFKHRFIHITRLDRLYELALAVIDHMLDHLCFPTREVALAMLELAIDELIKSEFHVVVTGDFAQLVFGAREATFFGLERGKAKHDFGIVNRMGLVGFVQVNAQRFGHADLVRSQAGRAFDRCERIDEILCHGGVFCGGRFAGRTQNGIVKNELFNHDVPFGLVSTLAFYQVTMRFVSAVSVLVANTPIGSGRLLESLQLAFDKRIAIGACGIFEACVANGKIVIGIEIVPTCCAREATGVDGFLKFAVRHRRCSLGH